MSLAPGTRLGVYEVTAQIGAGGMGEVYKGRDTRLDRTVAIKVLLETLVADPQFRERFDREARTISRLTHPNICTLCDVGEQDGTAFLVMEFLDGETLADRLTKGALPLDEALKIAIQVADALGAAHRQGIVHRDLKPGNVMLTKGGAKLLDFGLAKAGTPITSVSHSMLPTTPANLTAQGTILGTFQYMAPEQLEGQEADARTDIFAFGAVLYEMLTGKKAFEGKSQASLIGAIMHTAPPPVSHVQRLAPASLNRIVATCLAKDPDDRWQSSGDLRRELNWVAEERVSLGSSAPISSPTAARSTWSRGLPWAIAALVLAIGGQTLWVRFRAPQVRLESSSLFLLSDQVPASSEHLLRSIAISPDGRRVAYAAVQEGVRRLYLRDLQALEAKPIAGTENGFSPFFAPDGKRLGFWAENALKVIGIDGGSPIILVQGGVEDRGATWMPDDTIIYSPRSDAGLFRVPGPGGTPQLLATPDATKHERSYRWPQMLPGGDSVLFTIAMSDMVSFDEARIAVRSLKTGEQHELLRGGSFASYVAPGYMLYARAGGIQAVRFDAARSTVEGPPTTVVDGVTTYPTTGAAQYAISTDGTLLYQRGGPDVGPTTAVTWVDRRGHSAPLSVQPAAYQQVSISPDGRFAALSIAGANSHIWALDLGRSTLTRLTVDSSNHHPFWTADGTRIAFVSARAGAQSLFWQFTERNTDPEPLTPGRIAWQGTLSPDGRTLAFAGPNPNSGFDIWIMAMDGNHQARPFVQTKFDEDSPRFSPDGFWLAYVSNETGAPEVYAQPFPGPGRRVRVSTEGGTAPIWSLDGRQLYYRNGTGLLAVRVSGAAVDLSPQKPELLFRKAALDEYDVASDGRFLMLEPVEAKAASSPIVVVLNWRENLKARVPTK